MEPTAFPNVRPAPFQFAQVPFGLLGRSAEPTLPAVGGYSRADLERMRLTLAQSGADPAMLARIDEVIGMRRGDAPLVMLRPTPAKAKRVAAAPQAAGINPFAALAGVLAQPQ
jgi:hypothetical protein